MINYVFSGNDQHLFVNFLRGAGSILISFIPRVTVRVGLFAFVFAFWKVFKELQITLRLALQQNDWQKYRRPRNSHKRNGQGATNCVCCSNDFSAHLHLACLIRQTKCLVGKCTVPNLQLGASTMLEGSSIFRILNRTVGYNSNATACQQDDTNYPSISPLALSKKSEISNTSAHRANVMFSFILCYRHTGNWMSCWHSWALLKTHFPRPYYPVTNTHK